MAETNISPSKDIIAALPGMYDSGGNWMPLGDSGMYVQNFEIANRDVISYIKDNSAGYSWTIEAETGFSKIFLSSGLGVGLGSEQRDRLTGNVISSDGKYVTGSVVDGDVYYPTFNPCGDAACLMYGAGLDLSGSGTQDYLKSLLIKNLNDAATVAAYGSIISPTGLGGQALNYGGIAASLGAGYIGGSLPSSIMGVGEDFVINAGLSKALGDSSGTRVGSVIAILDLKDRVKKLIGGEGD
ncbi:hypothetical protein [Pseudomonas citronellolis]|uniref:hypothetical protein n=1 Tax=Pseudomonas citronellolis TaxID=53408 RepID=UPI0023E39B58|nr:hypothetical protein [Pseudomonas citronellolis]MDF3934996.1 hypothetical protein [Pseudomonas citronellolis]